VKALRYHIVTGKDRPDLMTLNNRVTGTVWPEFMLHDPVAELFPELYQKLPQYQFALLDVDTDTAIALGNSVPLAWDGNPGELPDTGWDWAMRKGIEDARAGNDPTVLCALQIAVASDRQGQGFSARAIKVMKSLGSDHHLRAMLAPVRPSQKADHALVSIDEYIKWKDEKGLPFDPWMRVHVRAGASIVKVCRQAMRITGTIADWEKWTGTRIPGSGRHLIPGALAPVEFDIEADLGTYIEPNVWMHHRL
jgi:hypothetical protein